MSKVTQDLRKRLRRMKKAIGVRLPFKSGDHEAADPVADKLRDLNWVDTEDEETARRQTSDQAVKGDGLATTVYNARPQNPFSKDF